MRRRSSMRQHKSSVLHLHPQEKGCGRSANEPRVQLALLTDDTAFYLRCQTERSISPHLQKAIDELAQWFQTWRIESREQFGGGRRRERTVSKALISGIKLRLSFVYAEQTPLSFN
ncbi:hypothetical protein EVAR_62660_1 [Eumeta japonica]|uniref:Uncharacterized protein n=1 Tax=Eumeta variegata TaxID=151549 RepID=A0A4C1Z3W2_EUMVA|nr:hypothetical protein EVAR_62660_1 [Eumeta japonica]